MQLGSLSTLFALIPRQINTVLTSPVPVHHLDLSLISLTRRLPVREERPKGTKTRSVDHFTESGVNPATTARRPYPRDGGPFYLAAGHVHVRERDVAQAFQKVPIKYDATDLSWVVFLHAGVLWASQHLSMPFGSTSANYAWHRIGSLLKVIIVKVFLGMWTTSSAATRRAAWSRGALA